MESFSGKFVLRMPPRMHERLKKDALTEGISLNELCLRRLESRRSQASSRKLFPDVAELWPGLRHVFPELIAMIVYGSRARGEGTAQSDLDLLLVLKPGALLKRSVYERWDKEILKLITSPSLARTISPQFTVLPQNARNFGGLWFEVAIDGHVIHSSDDEIFRFLHHIRIAIAEGKVIRKVVHGQPYWIHRERSES